MKVGEGFKGRNIGLKSTKDLNIKEVGIIKQDYESSPSAGDHESSIQNGTLKHEPSLENFKRNQYRRNRYDTLSNTINREALHTTF